MNVKIAILLLSVVAAASAEFYIATFYADKDCKDANGGYVNTEEAGKCNAPNTECTAYGNIFIKDRCSSADIIKAEDFLTGVIAYTDDKCTNGTGMYAVRDFDKCYIVGDNAFSFSKCNDKGETAFSVGNSCNNPLQVGATYGPNCVKDGDLYIRAFCASSAAHAVVGVLALLLPLLAL